MIHVHWKLKITKWQNEEGCHVHDKNEEGCHVHESEVSILLRCQFSLNW